MGYDDVAVVVVDGVVVAVADAVGADARCDNIRFRDGVCRA